MDNNTEKQEPGKVSRRGLFEGVRKLFSPDQAPKTTSTVSSSEQPKKERSHRKGVSRRGFLKAAGVVGGAAIIANTAPSMVVNALREPSGSDNNIVDPIGPVDKGNGFPPKGLAKATEVTQETREQQITTAEVIGMPYASLTDGDKKLIDGAFDTTETSYAGVLKQPKIEGTKFVGLPLESGSDAEKKVQQLVSLDYTMEKAGDLPEVHMAIDEKQGIVSSVVTNGDKPFQNGEKTFKQGTYFYLDDQGGTHYLELTDRPGGEEDKIMIIPVTDALRTDVGRFIYNEAPVKIAGDAKYVLGQVSKSGDIILLITKDFPLFFVRVEGSPQPTATPSSNTSTDLKPPVTPIPEQVLAKVVPETAKIWEESIIPSAEKLGESTGAGITFYLDEMWGKSTETKKVPTPKEIQVRDEKSLKVYREYMIWLALKNNKSELAGETFDQFLANRLAKQQKGEEMTWQLIAIDTKTLKPVKVDVPLGKINYKGNLSKGYDTFDITGGATFDVLFTTHSFYKLHPLSYIYGTGDDYEKSGIFVNSDDPTKIMMVDSLDIRTDGNFGLYYNGQFDDSMVVNQTARGFSEMTLAEAKTNDILNGKITNLNSGAGVNFYQGIYAYPNITLLKARGSSQILHIS